MTMSAIASSALPNAHYSQREQFMLPVTAVRSNWGRMECRWDQNTDGQTTHHVWAACVDIAEQSIYNDDSTEEIYVKIACQLIARPFHALIKTIYHLFSVAILLPLEPGETVRHLYEAVTTPLGDLAILVVSVAALAFAIFNPLFVYEARKLIGKIERASELGRTRTDWTLTPCFEPFSKTFLMAHAIENFSDTDYPSALPLDRALANFARRNIKHQQKEIALFGSWDLREVQVQ